MRPPPTKRPRPPATKEKETTEVTDPSAPIDMLQTAQMRVKPRKPGPPPPVPAAQPVEDEPPPAGPGERTLIYDQNKGRPPGTGAKLIITAGPRAGSEVPLGEGETTIGRGSDNTIVVPALSVSRRHLVLRKDPSGWVLLAQGSANAPPLPRLTLPKPA